MGSSKMPPYEPYHYTHADQVPSNILKYWHQRHKIFSKFDEGIWMTKDAWFGVTPEPIALTIAEHVATAPESKSVIIDCFAGAGGNVIAFALSGRWSRIFAVEKDPEVLACAKHNAEIYGVSDQIWWINDDIFNALENRLQSVAKEAVLFASPPWGGREPDEEEGRALTSAGPTYTDWDVFDLTQMEPYSVNYILDAFNRFKCREIVLYLPRTSDLRQLAETVKEGEQAQVTHYCMHGSSKALCIYYGRFE